jgi:hypothetical protein
METEKSTIGTATMAADGTMVFRLRDEFKNLGEVYFKYERGTSDYEWAQQYIGGLEPGKEKPIPAFPADSYNTASMSGDRTLHLGFRPAELPGGGMSEPLILEFKPENPQYTEMLRYVGDIEPGQSKLVPPFTSTYFRTR